MTDFFVMYGGKLAEQNPGQEIVYQLHVETDEEHAALTAYFFGDVSSEAGNKVPPGMVLEIKSYESNCSMMSPL